VRAGAPVFVVVADTWLPGWTAAVDGARAPVHRVNHLMRGVPVPGGAHRLELRYVPQGCDRVGGGLARGVRGVDRRGAVVAAARRAASSRRSAEIRPNAGAVASS